MIDCDQLMREPGPRAPRRRFVGTALVGAVVLMAVANRRELTVVGQTLAQARPNWCVVSALLFALWIANSAGLLRASLRATGVQMPLRNVAAGTAIAHCLNLTTKSGGLAGVLAVRAEARRSRLPENSVIAGYVLGAMLTEWAFALTVLGAFAVLTADGHISVTEVVGLCIFAVYAGSRLGLVVAATRDRQRLRRLMRLPTRFMSWLRHRSPGDALARSDATADRMFDSLHAARSSGRALMPAVFHAVATELIAVTLLASCLRAVGVSLGPVQSLVAYSVAGLFGIIGFLPGGLGFVEVSLTAVLVGFGVRGVAAASAVVLYRIFELWLPIVIGSVMAHRLRFDG